MLQDDQILYDELRQQQSRGGRRKSLRLPLRAPAPRRTEDEGEARAEDNDTNASERGVRVLDMKNGYSVVE